MSKYLNIPTEADGYKFKSGVERDRYQELKYRMMADEIRALTIQPKFIILPAFVYKERRIGQVTFTADFQYIESYLNPDSKVRERIVVEDVKGRTAKLTQLFSVKWKFVKAQNPKTDFRIVRM